MAWKQSRKHVRYVEPSNLEELLSCSVWWCPSLALIGSGFSKQRAMTLHKRGMRFYRDIWQQSRFMDPLEAQATFGLLPQEEGAWTTMIHAIHLKWHDLLRQSNSRLDSGEWFGIFNDVDILEPMRICQTAEGFQPGLGFCTIEIPDKIDVFVPNSAQGPYICKMKETTRKDTMSLDASGEVMVNRYRGLIRRVRVVSIKRQTKKLEMLLYYGRVDQLQWDPERFVWEWKGGTPLMNYDTKMGRLMLRRHHQIPSVVERK